MPQHRNAPKAPVPALENLTRLRTALCGQPPHGLSLEGAARYVDLSRQYLHQMERGESDMNVSDLRRTCNAFGASADWLINLRYADRTHPAIRVFSGLLRQEMATAKQARPALTAIQWLQRADPDLFSDQLFIARLGLTESQWRTVLDGEYELRASAEAERLADLIRIPEKWFASGEPEDLQELRDDGTYALYLLDRQGLTLDDLKDYGYLIQARKEEENRKRG